MSDIAEFAREIKPGFLVVGQNAPELASNSRRYRSIVDAVAQEQTWFDGAADNRPPGDCPLPRREAQIESASYVRGLSKPCRKMHDEFPDSTLHVSSQWYLRHLTKLKRQGEVVFTVDYARKPGNVNWVLETSRGHGFIPFVGTRLLNRYVPPR